MAIRIGTATHLDSAAYDDMAASTHSPDLGGSLCTRIPGCDRHVVDEVGRALLLARPKLIVTETLR